MNTSQAGVRRGYPFLGNVQPHAQKHVQKLQATAYPFLHRTGFVKPKRLPPRALVDGPLEYEPPLVQHTLVQVQGGLAGSNDARLPFKLTMTFESHYLQRQQSGHPSSPLRHNTVARVQCIDPLSVGRPPLDRLASHLRTGISEGSATCC